MEVKVGWFSTGKDSQALEIFEKTLEAIEREKIVGIKISYVFCNREKGEGKESDRFTEFVEKRKIPLICFSSSKFEKNLRKKALKEAKKGNFSLLEKWRILYDRQIIEKIKKMQADLIFLAGYMLILGKELCEKFTILNLHPALPGGPKGTWQEVIWQLIEKRADKTGIMIHKVIPEVDSGPALFYCEFSLKGEKFRPLWKNLEEKLKQKTLPQIKKEEGEEEPLFKAIREEQKKREIPLVLSTLEFIGRKKPDLKKIKKPFLLKV